MKKLETMGQRIRALRREKKLTQGDLAKIVGVSAPNVTGWEKDAYAPKADPLSKMAAYFGVSTSYITNGDESGPQLDNNAVQLNVLDIEAFKKNTIFQIVKMLLSLFEHQISHSLFKKVCPC